MQKRCPSVRFVGIARLPDHTLAFTRTSEKRNCGVADAMSERGAQVWGVVYEIDDIDVGRLDRSEGFQPGRETNSYTRRECIVFRDGDDKQPLTVSTYFADPQPNPPLPNHEYKNLILSGARHWSLPAHYIADLEKVMVAR
jgi:gamma-glutamylcyclotransferase (GGCT)/AIG2-like uncharacterized protein YtfP